MGILSDQGIIDNLYCNLGEYGIDIEPYDPELLQPASYELTLGNEFKHEPRNDGSYHCDLYIPVKPFDPRCPEKRKGIWQGNRDENNKPILVDWEDSVLTQTTNAEQFIIKPKEFILAHTVQKITLGKRFAAEVRGKSSWARVGISIHQTAGWVDPGFSGQIVLEIYNMNSRPIVLRAGDKIAQLTFIKLDSPCKYGYGHEKHKNHYQGQEGTKGADFSIIS